MKKLQKICFSTLLTFLLVVLAACAPIAPPDNRERADIQYRGSANGTVCALPQGLFQEGVDYPTEYIVGEGIIVPSLKTSCVEGSYEYTFLGWYWDVACEQPFDVISATQEGEIALYAKLAISAWSGRL